MKTIKFFTLSLLMTVALAGQAQQITEPGWYKVENVKSLPPGSPRLAAAHATLSPLSIPTAPAIAEAITPEIQALARGLENDPARIFDYVHDHIRHILYYGSKKGAQLTLLERSGNDFDQCALLVALLQAAGYSNVGYQYGVLKMPYDSADHNDLHHWLGLSLVNTNWTNTTNFFANLFNVRGYPIDPIPLWFDEGDNNTIAFQRVWVTLTIGVTTYYLDPAFKISEPVTGINLASAMGFSSNAVMTAVGAGATNTPDYVKNLNEPALRSTLQGYNSNLLASIQSNYPNASVQQILGGQQITPWTNALSQSLMFPADTRGGVYPVLTWANIPTAFMSTFGISFWGVNTNWYFPQLQGGRLSLTFSNNGVARLWLEDTLIASQTNTSGSSTVSVTLAVTHPSAGWDTVNNIPYDTGGAPYGYDRSIAATYQCTNASYGIIYAFEPDMKWLNEREQVLDTYRQQGLADNSRQVLTESLNIMGLNWMIQTKLNEDILDQQIGVLPQYQERLGRMAQESGRGYYVDVYFQYSGMYPNSGANPQDLQNRNKAFDLGGYIGSAMEHGLIEQLQNSGLVAASTVKLLELASTNHQTIYLANSANWTSGANVRSHLVNYNLGSFDTLISQGFNLLLPTNGLVQIAGAGSWAGSGFVEQQVTANGESIGMIIGGGYNGGYVSIPTAVPDPIVISYDLGYTTPTFAIPTPVFTPISFSADPVNMADASFGLNTTDLSLGQAEPLGMTLTRYYTPARRHLNLANMANGWVNSYYFNLAEVSAPPASLGETTPAQMAPMLVTTCVALNLYNPQPDPKNWMVTVLTAKWGIDQIISNAVSITLGNDTLEFIRQPGGGFTPPANCTMTLTNSGSTYKLQARHGNTFNFSSSTKQLTTITNQSGDTMTLTYTSGQLTQAKDWKNRTLGFTYSGTPSRLTQVADSSSPGRVVKYGYTTNVDGRLDLVSVTDPDNNTNTFTYDTNHQILATKDALGRLVVTNIYDGFGRIMTQYTQGDTNKMWQIYWSGWETVSQDPAGNKQRYFYDDQTRLIGQQDPLGNTSQTIYDGQNHVVMTISPLNETNQTIYDGNNNPIYTIDPLGFTNQFIYDSQNSLRQSVDARGNPCKFGYDAKFRLTGTTNGAGDWVNYTYNTDGTLATRVDPGGTNSYAYDINGVLSKITYPGGLGTNGFLNNAFGDVLSQTNARGFVTSFKYNNRRQLTNSVAPTNMVTKIVYDAIGNTVSVTDARVFTSSNAWSVTRHLLATTLPPTPAGTATITNAYDNRDWLVKTVNPLSQATLYTNDAAQRLVSATDPLLRTTTLGYDADGHNLASTNAAHNVTAQQYDARGSLTVLTDPANRIVQRAYDGAGNQVTLTNRNGKKWQFQFDAANRLTNTISPLGRSSSQVYNNRGLLITNREPSTQTQAFNYDAKGRLTNRTDSVGTTVYKYDANDNPTNVVENGLTNAWTYDAYDRVASFKDINGNLIQYKYDLNGNVTNLVYPGNKNVSYAYDSLNHLTNVTDWSNRKTSIAYDLAGRLTGITRPNGTQRIINYDAAGQTTNITEKAANGNIIAFYKLGWDNAARMQTEYGAPLPHAATVPTRTMTFDDDNRLTGVDGNTIVNDADGNMTSGPLTNDTLFAYTYDARNRLLNAGGVTNAYDPSGNRVGIAYGTNSVAYVINPNSKLSQVLMRVKNGTTNYYIYGAGLLYQVTESATVTNTLTYHYDFRGSTVALTDSAGTNVTDRIEYSAYATTTYRTGTNDTPFLFNGRYGVMTDPNGLLNMRARFYNPFICRFLNPDPTGFSGGLNFYAYANGNPVSYLDPFGLLGWSDVGDYFVGVGQVFQGYGLAARDTAVGLYNAVDHPINTVVGLANVATHPVQAYNAISQSVANTWNSGLTGQGEILGNVFIAAATIGSGAATATTRAAQIAAAEPTLAEGMNTFQLLNTYGKGAQALNEADYAAYGSELTSPLYKGLLMQQGVDIGGSAYSITTTFGQRIGTSVGLIDTGLTPGAAFGAGAIGAGVQTVDWLGNVGQNFGTSSH